MSAERSGSGEARIDLVTHCDIEINAPRERIWPYLLQPEAWKCGVLLVPEQSDSSSRRRFNAVLPNEPARVLYLVQDVECAPHVRRTIRMNECNGALIGFASWTLAISGEVTRVAYNVYCQVKVTPDEQQEWPHGIDRESQREAYVAIHRQRFEQELLALKHLIK